MELSSINIVEGPSFVPEFSTGTTPIHHREASESLSFGSITESTADPSLPQPERKRCCKVEDLTRVASKRAALQTLMLAGIFTAGGCMIGFSDEKIIRVVGIAVIVLGGKGGYCLDWSGCCPIQLLPNTVNDIEIDLDLVSNGSNNKS